MADITWPTTNDWAFRPAAQDEGVEFDVEITVKRNGGVETQGMPGAVWTNTLRFDDTTVAHLPDRRQIEALLASLKGGANRLLLWNLLQPEPLGTARGAVTVVGSVAVGANAATITGAAAWPNLLTNSGFELDGNADGLADGWTGYSGGSVSGVAYNFPAGNGSAAAQRCFVTSLGAGGGDVVGIKRTALTPVTGGLAYTLAADAISNFGTAGVRLLVDWYEVDGTTFISTSSAGAASPTSWVRRSLTAAAPLTAAWARPYMWMEGAGVVLTNAQTYFDNVQFEQAAAASAYAGLPTLLRGDRIAWAGQRVLLTADAAGTDDGTMTIAFEPARRTASSGGAAVTLVRPTTRYVVTSPQVLIPARGDVLPGFAIEMVEAP